MGKERFAPAMGCALLAPAFVLLAGNASAQSPSKFSLCTESGTLSSRVEFADVQRAKQILARRDPWAKQLSEFDLALRQKTAEPTSLQQFLAFASDAALDWTPDERAAWQPVIGKLSAALTGLNLPVPNVDCENEWQGRIWVTVQVPPSIFLDKSRPNRLTYGG